MVKYQCHVCALIFFNERILSAHMRRTHNRSYMKDSWKYEAELMKLESESIEKEEE